ncbi:hypothetical protein CLAIMM_07363 isoform 2 [Cladophialophora immunda]|nr:hypothetical protein CLAIMM_07363 isoform 1 [Cladophialophora immunda]OQV02121.1 hypothetical protein CLAIMM_07363 isoform 2 [Cladophialophora immunda]
MTIIANAGGQGGALWLRKSSPIKAEEAALSLATRQAMSRSLIGAVRHPSASRSCSMISERVLVCPNKQASQDVVREQSLIRKRFSIVEADSPTRRRRVDRTRSS